MKLLRKLRTVWCGIYSAWTVSIFWYERSSMLTMPSRTSSCRAALTTFPQCFVVVVCSDGIGFGLNCVRIWCCEYFCWVSLLSKKACCGTKNQAQSCLFSFLAGIVPNFFLAAKVPNFFFGSQNHFWQLARGNSWHSYWVQYFVSEKRLWQNLAKIKRWHDFCQK